MGMGVGCARSARILPQFRDDGSFNRFMGGLGDWMGGAGDWVGVVGDWVGGVGDWTRGVGDWMGNFGGWMSGRDGFGRPVAGPMGNTYMGNTYGYPAY